MYIITEIKRVTEIISAELRNAHSCDNSIFHIGFNEESEFRIEIMESTTHTQIGSYDITPNVNKDPIWL